MRGQQLTVAALPAEPTVPAASSHIAPPQTSSTGGGRGARRDRPPRLLRITPAQSEESVRSQHRFLAGRSDWPLEPSWKYGGRASKWGEAVWNALTTWWLRRLEGGEVRYVKLKIFLQWVQQQRQEQREREDRRQQQQLQGQVQDASGSSKGSDMFTVPPCVACLEARPTELCTPCHHLCLCEACPLHLMQEDDVRCPVCRNHLEGFTKAFYWLH